MCLGESSEWRASAPPATRDAQAWDRSGNLSAPRRRAAILVSKEYSRPVHGVVARHVLAQGTRISFDGPLVPNAFARGRERKTYRSQAPRQKTSSMSNRSRRSHRPCDPGVSRPRSRTRTAELLSSAAPTPESPSCPRRTRPVSSARRACQAGASRGTHPWRNSSASPQTHT